MLLQFQDAISMTCRMALIFGLLFVSARAHATELPKPALALIESRCIECHDAENKKGGLDLRSISSQLDDAATEAKWTLIYDRVQQGEMPPKDETPLAVAERDAFVQSLGDFLREQDAARQARSGRVVLRRLNRVEYENTMHDLLGIDIPLAEYLPEDGAAGGFDNVSTALRLSAIQIEAYLTTAEKALDAALNIGPQPKVKKQRFSYLDIQQIKDMLAKPTGSLQKDGSRSYQYFRALPDALVIYPNELWETIIRESRADVAGRYRVRISAYAYQSNDRPTVVAKLMITTFTRNRFGAAFDLIPDTPRIGEATIHLNEGELIYLSATGSDFAPDGTHVQDVGGEKFTGTGMAVQWVEMEGPLLESWPPPSVKRVYGDLSINQSDKRLANGRWYEVVVPNPNEEIRKLVNRFAGRAFRRPVSDDDTARYTRLAEQALTEGAAFENAVVRACKAILTAPEFHFLQENVGRLDDFALASRLSYFLWSTMPDDELLQLAAEGRLHEPVTLQAQTERMLNSPKAQAFTRNFCGQWLNLRAIKATTPDRQLYPEYDELLENAMIRETEAFFNELLRGDLSISNVIDSDFAMLNRRLAEHYQIPNVLGEEIRKVSLPEKSHRGGVMTQASILKVTANGTLSSPVVRGAWVLKRILGRTLQAPPADAGGIEPDTRGATTIREQLAKHRRSVSCNSCHKFMDPPGFALESYDVIGGWREFYRTTQGQGAVAIDPLTKRHLGYRQGAPVDASGELADGRPFSDVDQLKKLLLEQKEAVALNVVNNLITYATGAQVTFADRTETRAILQRARNRDYGLRTLVHEIIQSPLFQTK